MSPTNNNTVDQFLKALEEILNDRESNHWRRKAINIELPERYQEPVSGKPNPYDYFEDIKPITKLSDKGLSLILETYYEILMSDEDIEDVVTAVRDRIMKKFTEAEADSGAYLL